MDTSSWIKLAPTLKVIDTKKKFFNKYLYKIVFNIPAGRIIQSKSRNMTIEEELEVRRKRLEARTTGYSYNYDWWAQNKLRLLNGVNVEHLKYIKGIVNQYKGQIKYRVEEPTVTLYSEDESLLYTISLAIPEALSELHKPANEHAINTLNRGEIIIKKPTEYTYKVIFRENNVVHETRDQIYNYLVSLGDTVKMTKSCRHNLTIRNFWFTQTYFYTKDESVIVFLNLIAPGTVAGIYKLVKLD